MTKFGITILESNYPELKAWVISIDPDAFCDLIPAGEDQRGRELVYAEIITAVEDIHLEAVLIWGYIFGWET